MKQLVLAGLLLLLGFAQAQDSPAERLLRNLFGPQSNVFVGKLPDSFPQDFPLPEAQLLGSVERPGGIVEVIFETSLPASSVIPRYRAALIRAGWRDIQFSGFAGNGLDTLIPQRTGPFPNERDPEGGRPLDSGPISSGRFCKGRQALEVSGIPVRLITSIRLSLRPDQSCDPRLNPAAFPIPTLQIPTELQSRPAGRIMQQLGLLDTIQVWTMQSLADLPKALRWSVSALMAELGQQLRDQGWREVEVGSSGSLHHSAWTRNVDGLEYYLQLIIGADDQRFPGIRMAQMFMFRYEPYLR